MWWVYSASLKRCKRAEVQLQPSLTQVPFMKRQLEEARRAQAARRERVRLAAQRAAIKAMQKVLETIKTDGDCSAMADEMASFKDREEIVNTAHFVEIDQRYAC